MLNRPIRVRYVDKNDVKEIIVVCVKNAKKEQVLKIIKRKL